jgi:hypothetical protein
MAEKRAFGIFTLFFEVAVDIHKTFALQKASLLIGSAGQKPVHEAQQMFNPSVPGTSSAGETRFCNRAEPTSDGWRCASRG